MEGIKLVVYGAGGLGREIAAMILHSELCQAYELVGFVDDKLPRGSMVNDIEVLGDSEYLSSVDTPLAVVLGVGNPEIRRELVGQVRGNSNLSWPNLIHPKAIIMDPANVKIGMGNVICAGTILTTNIEIGDFNFINLSCTIGHDTRLGNYCSLMPTVNVSGGAKLLDGVYVGTGAKLIKATKLGENCIVGAGSVVTKDVPADVIVKGVPAK